MACWACRALVACSKPSIPALAGTAGLMNALDWLASGSARGRCATHRLHGHCAIPWEPPESRRKGAGAVAMLIGEDPRVLQLRTGVSGTFSQNVHDLASAVSVKMRFVDGQFSVQCYLDALAGAAIPVAATQRMTCRLSGPAITFPYGKMKPRKAYQRRCQIDGLTDEAADKSYTDQGNRRCVCPSQVGNIYTRARCIWPCCRCCITKPASYPVSASVCLATARAALRGSLPVA